MNLEQRTTDLEVVHGEIQVGPTANELAAIVVREHELAVQCGIQAILHAMAAGDALLEAKNHSEAGNWQRWCAESTGLHYATCVRYMRLAYYRDAVLSDGLVSIEQGLRMLKGKPRLPQVGAGIDPDLKRKMKKLESDGVSKKDIAEVLGVSRTLVYYYLVPGWAEKHRAASRSTARRQREAKRALERERAGKQIKARGGSIAEAYSLALRLEAVLAQAHREKDATEARKAVSAAENHVRQALYDIMRAEGVLEDGRQTSQRAQAA